MKILIWFLIIALLTGIVLADGYGDCPYGKTAYGKSCVSPAPSKPPVTSPSTGGVSAPPSLNATRLFGGIPVNGTCPIDEQLLDGRCYECDPLTSYLEFRSEE